jgi:hypothetical protein
MLLDALDDSPCRDKDADMAVFAHDDIADDLALLVPHDFNDVCARRHDSLVPTLAAFAVPFAIVGDHAGHPCRGSSFCRTASIADPVQYARPGNSANF